LLISRNRALQRGTAFSSALIYVEKPSHIVSKGLDDIVTQCRGKNLFFSTDVEKHSHEADIVFVLTHWWKPQTWCIGRVRSDDRRCLKVWQSCREINCSCQNCWSYREKYDTMQKVSNFRFCQILNFLPKELQFKTFSIQTEFSWETEKAWKGENAIQTLKKVYPQWIPDKKILATYLWSAEVSKLAANAFLAQRISSVNAISRLCKATGANVNKVSYALGTGTRIGPKFLNSRVGFCGSYFQNDIEPGLDLWVSCFTNSFWILETKDSDGICILTEWEEFKKVFDISGNEKKSGCAIGVPFVFDSYISV